MNIIKRIDEILGSDQMTLWASADISYSEFKDKYCRAIVVAQKYDGLISNDNYIEQDYHALMMQTKDTIDAKISLLKELFDQQGIKNYLPPLAQTDELSLTAPFSFKYAAVQAGLGWIGKSGVLVTRAFGPRVRLASILVDYPLKCGKPMDRSFCGDCHACIDACPYGLIKGAEWNPLTRRDELLDFYLCNEKRSEYIQLEGRKNTCGYCLLACPWGLNKA